MNAETDVDKQILEAERQLRFTQSEIKKLTQELTRQREQCKAAEQREIDAFTEAGGDVLDFEPSRPLNAMKLAVARQEQNLENLQQREIETKKQIDKLKGSKIESHLLQQSKVVVELKKRESEILEQLKEIQQQIEVAEALKAELAVMVADRADG
jgi:tRNA splicing endonuclease